MLARYVPPYDSTVVERLHDAGCVMLGKTNMDEFGMGSVSSSFFGTVKNPLNISFGNEKLIDLESNQFLISGGSSGGSAASVSAGLAEL